MFGCLYLQISDPASFLLKVKNQLFQKLSGRKSHAWRRIYQNPEMPAIEDSAVYLTPSHQYT